LVELLQRARTPNQGTTWLTLNWKAGRVPLAELTDIWTYTLPQLACKCCFFDSPSTYWYSKLYAWACYFRYKFSCSLWPACYADCINMCKLLEHVSFWSFHTKYYRKTCVHYCNNTFEHMNLPLVCD
jgi:hypothetical protein